MNSWIVTRFGNFLENRRDYFWWVFTFCAAVYLIPLFVTPYLPLVDFPPFVAEISILKNYTNPQFGFYEQFAIHWLTPDALGYLIAGTFSRVFSAVLSVKLLIALVILAYPLALLSLLKKLESPPYWSLMGFPLICGQNYLWGYITFLVSMPLGMFLLSRTLETIRNDSAVNLALLSLLSLVLFFSHLFTFIVFLGLAVLMVLTGHLNHRRKLIILASLSVGLVPAIWWWAVKPELNKQLELSSITAKDFMDRIVRFPGRLLSFEFDRTAQGTGLGLLATIVFSANGLRKNRTAWAFFLCTFIFLFLFPRSHYRLDDRFFPLAVLSLFFVLKHPFKPKFLLRVLHVTLVLIWGGILIYRHAGFATEVRNFDTVIALMKPNKSLLPLSINQTSRYSPGPIFMHVPHLYQAQKGGILGTSFCLYPHHVTRYRPGVNRHPFERADGLGWFPKYFDWKKDGLYDYYVVRSRNEEKESIFKEGAKNLRLVAKVNFWWLYERIGNKI